MASDHSQLDHKVFTEYGELMDEDATCATFVRMLVEANDAWPRRPYWAGHDDVAVAKLTKAGLVIVEGKRYTIKGLDKRRQRRRDIASAGGRALSAIRSASSSASSTSPRSEEPRDTDTGRGRGPSIASSSATSSAGSTPDDPLAALYDVKAGQVYEDNVAFVNEMAAEYGDELVARCIRESAGRDGVKGKFLTRVKGLVVIEAERQAKAAEAARKKAAAEEAKRERERIANATPEERARAEKVKAGIAAYLKGSAA